MMCAHLTTGMDVEQHLDCLQTSLFKKSDTWWVAAGLRELHTIENVNEIIRLVRQHAEAKKQSLCDIRVIINDTIDLSKVKNAEDIKLFSINFYRMLTYYHKYHTKHQDCPQQFNSEYEAKENKALFLMGKPYQPHRTPVLVELIERGLKDKLVYSWNPGRQSSEVFKATEFWVRELIGENYDFKNFARLHVCKLDIPDHVPLFDTSETCYHYTGFPFDASLYYNTALSIVSETNHINMLDSSLPWTTEKIWKAIANHHPFIIIGEPGIVAKLRNLGYETWDSFLKHDQYKANKFWDTNYKSAISMNVDNVEYFLKQDKHRHTIKSLAKKNADLMDEQVRDEINNIFDNDTDLFEQFIKNARYPNLAEGKAIKDIG